MTQADRPLKKGIAYHSNRLLSHVREDMQEIVQSGFDIVLHTFSHNDWDRHKNIMKDIFTITKENGLDVWVDNWGLGGPPGDKSHFLSYYPDAHQIYNTGKVDPIRVCLNNQDFIKFTKNWIDVVKECGGDTIFWDEPHLVGNHIVDGKPQEWSCTCPVCQKLFEEKYNKPMPMEFTDEIAEFRVDTVARYFTEVSDYAKSLGMINTICVMLGEGFGINLDSIASLGAVKSLDNIGSDPYWVSSVEGFENTYRFVYEKTKQNLEVCEKYGKDHNIWVQGFGNPHGREDEIIAATEAIYDAGARNIFVWGYRGSDSNDYRAEIPEFAWKATKDAFARITERDRSKRLSEIRKSLGIE
jgi:hypothetical protein